VPAPGRTASRLPYLALLAVCLISLGVRSAWIGLPCHLSCRTANAHVLIFDERYYVNAARVTAGVQPAASPGVAYRHAPLGSDPNAEHPQLAKLVMAGSIELLGDGPWAWRLGSLILGTLAILGMFALVRGAGGGPWLAVGAAALMAADNLMLVQGRIGTLEVYVVAAMVWSVALYLRGRPLAAGLVAGIGACVKLFALDIVPVLVLLELFHWRAAICGPRGEGSTNTASSATWRALLRRPVARLGAALAVMAGSFIGLLAVLGEVAPPYDNSARRFIGGGPWGHLSHMISYAGQQTGVSSAHGIASRPWEWLADYKPIAYLTIDPAHPAGLRGDHPAVHFLGFISPPILLAGLVGTALALWVTLAPRARHSVRALGGSAVSAELLRVSAAWSLGTFVPFLMASLAFSRTTYLYYATIVMPGMYMAAAWLAWRLWSRRWLIVPWAFLVVVAATVLYPFTPLP
jgi:hypothetical protein